MAQRKYLDLNSAYGQLILLIFIPVAVVACVGAYLVVQQTNAASHAQQQAQAIQVLNRFEPIVKELLPYLAIQNIAPQNLSSQDLAWQNQVNQKVYYQESYNQLLSQINSEQNLKRWAVIDDNGEVILSLGVDKEAPWSNLSNMQPQQKALSNAPERLALTSLDSGSASSYTAMTVPISTPVGTAYGQLIGQQAGIHYWQYVDMDNDSINLATLKASLAIISTVLITLLLLLLVLNVFAKRWVVPLFNLRLHLQQTTSENLYRPIATDSSGELNLLQQDLIKTLRRLHTDFQELSDHAEQTENDLKLAFDEMEIRNISNRRARDAAVSTSQAKSAFLANISHELRTPLNSIDGFINLLSRDGELSLEQNLYVQTIRKSSAHLLALVNDVLDFSKIEAGKLVLDSHEFDLYAAIYDVMDMLSPLAAEKNLKMAVLYYNDVPAHIIGDALRVKQVLTNLVSNAIKFTESGEVVVRITLDDSDSYRHIDNHDINSPNIDNTKIDSPTNLLTNPPHTDNQQSLNTQNDDYSSGSIDGYTSNVNAHEDSGFNDSNYEENGYVEPPTKIAIAVQDTGRGISTADQQQLFKSFSQGDPSITRQYGGTGLGLVISKQLTRLMGGNIGFYDNNQKRVEQDKLNRYPNGSVDANYHSSSNSSGSSSINSSGNQGSTFWFTIPAHVDVIDTMENESHDMRLPILSRFSDALDDRPYQLLVWLNHKANRQVLSASLRPLNIEITQVNSLAVALEQLKEQSNRWDWVIIDGSENIQDDMAALLKQIRLHYQGKLALFGYQVTLDATILARYKAFGLYQPLDKRQLYDMLDTQTAKKPLLPTAQWDGITVLAVDDHPPNLLVLEALLQELRIKVITASSGFDAIEIVNKQLVNSSELSQAELAHIDLIFMDIQMPYMSGHEAAEQIRLIEHNIHKSKGNSDNTKRIPIIALTAHGLSDERAKLMRSGIDDYVSKPISQPQLLQILQRWLNKDTPVTPSIHKASIQSAEQQDLDESNNSLSHHLNHSESSSEDYHFSASTLDTSEKIQNLPIIDWEDALIRSANKPDLAAQLFTMLRDTVTDEISELTSAWQAQNRTELAQIAHRILGASRYTGVPQIRQASQDFEDKCLLNVQHTTPVQFIMLQPYFDALIVALQNLKNVKLEDYPKLQQAIKAHVISENDMTWKMI